MYNWKPVSATGNHKSIKSGSQKLADVRSRNHHILNSTEQWLKWPRSKCWGHVPTSHSLTTASLSHSRAVGSTLMAAVPAGQRLVWRLGMSAGIGTRGQRMPLGQGRASPSALRYETTDRLYIEGHNVPKRIWLLCWEKGRRKAVRASVPPGSEGDLAKWCNGITLSNRLKMYFKTKLSIECENRDERLGVLWASEATFWRCA